MEENLNTENKQTKFDQINIINKLKLKSYLSTTDENQKIILCGKMNEHNTNSKYCFKACEFFIYTPFNNSIYYSDMNSDDCFTNALKWNPNFFKKIRLSLTSIESIKNTYYSINYEKKPTTNLIEIDLNEDSLLEDRKIYLELHLIVDGQDIIAFRLLMKKLIEDNPEQLLISKIIEMDKKESEVLVMRQKKFLEKEVEFEKMKREVNEMELNNFMMKEKFILNFCLLNHEKNLKIEELQSEINNEKYSKVPLFKVNQ